MPDPELDVVLAAYEAFARGDIAAAVRDMDEAVEWVEPIAFENGGRRVGVEAVAEYLEASRAAWKHLTSEPTATRVGPEIVVVHKLHGNLLDGTPREAEVADVFRFREGRIARMRAYAAPEEAFAAAPLRRWVDAYRDYANLWLVELDDEGRATGFSEWWKQLPDDAAG